MNEEFSWNTFLEVIKSKISSVSFDTWFKDTKIASMTDNSITIIVPMTFHKDFLNNNYYDEIESILKTLTGKTYDISFVVEEDIISDTQNITVNKVEKKRNFSN